MQIDTAPVAGDPEATIEKMRTIQAPALAPANPSSADRAVAAKAAKMAIDARLEATRSAAEEGVDGEGGSEEEGGLDRPSPYSAPLDQGLGEILSKVA